MALTQVTTEGIKDGTITGTDLATNIDLVDNQKIRLGNGQDLLIFHDGTNSSIQNGTGTLRLRGDSIKLNNNSASENYLVATANGAVELYHDNSKKLHTTSSGIQIEGGGILNGAGGNTTILHLKNATDTDGTKLGHSSNSNAGFLQVTEGNAGFNLQVGGANISNLKFQCLENNGNTQLVFGTEKALVAVPNGAVELYHDNSKKFETTSSGINIIGMIDTTENIDIDADNQALRIGDNQNFQLVFTGSEAIIKNVGATSPIKIKVKDGVEDAIVCNANGSVELYHDNSKKFETTSSGVTVTGGLTTSGASTFNEDATFTGASANIVFDKSDNALEFADNAYLKLGTGDDLQIHHNGSTSFIENLTGDLNIRAKQGEESIKLIPNGEVDLYHDGQARLSTRAGGVDIRREAEVFVQMARTNNGQTDGDNVSTLIGLGKDDANNFTEYSKMITQIVDASNGTEDSRLMMLTMKNGTMTTAATIEAGYFQRNNAPGFAAEGFQWVNTNPNMHNSGNIKFTSGDFNNSTGIFTCPVAGKYLCMATVQSHRTNDNTGASTQYFNVLFQKNNSNYFGETVGTQHANGGSSTSTSANHFQITQTVIIDCAANDTIRAHSNHGYRYAAQNQLCIMLLA